MDTLEAIRAVTKAIECIRDARRLWNIPETDADDWMIDSVNTLGEALKRMVEVIEP